MQSLFPNDTGAAVRFVQERLNQLGFGPVELTSTIDVSTLSALEAFQDERQLAESRQVGDQTWLALLEVEGAAGGPLAFGQTGQPVPEQLDFAFIGRDGTGWLLSEVQLRLRALGYPCGGESTNGPKTQDGLRTFQASQYLEITGELDSETLLALRIATRESGPIFLFAEDDALRDAGGPLTFGGDSREVAGEGGYRYRQDEDGAITILSSPGRALSSRTLRSGAAWAAITAEIGPFPASAITLSVGDRGEGVRGIQLQLNRLGFGPLDADGAFGPMTASALRRFQVAAGLTDSGVADSATKARLDAPWPTLSLGASGEEVRRLQERLRALGVALGSATGSFDEATVAAVRAYQAREKLPVTGEIDAITHGHLLGAQTTDLPDALLLAERARLHGLAEQALASLPPEAVAGVRAVMEEAISWVGKREIPKGSNGGPEIDVITAGVVPAGTARPPWCALAVSHWLREGLHATRWQDTPLGFRNASALAFGRWGEAKGRLLAPSEAAPVGSIFVMRREGSGSDAGASATGAGRWDGLGHTGLVVADLGDRVVTIDGNISDRCWSSTRAKAGLLGFVRWW